MFVKTGPAYSNTMCRQDLNIEVDIAVPGMDAVQIKTSRGTVKSVTDQFLGANGAPVDVAGHRESVAVTLQSMTVDLYLVNVYYAL
jgi:hypothetical protein